MKHNIYLLKSFGPDNQVLYKIGYSADIEKRFTQYFSHNPFIQLVNTWYVSEGINFERALHSLIKSQIRREWYTEDEVNQLIPYIESGQLPDEETPRMGGSFRTILKTYCEDRDNNVISDLVLTVEADKEYEMVVEAYKVLGSDKLKALEYIKKNVQEAMYSKSDNVKSVILNALTKKYKSGDFVPSAELKAFFANQYVTFKVKKSAKASDIMEYFPQSTESSKRVDGIKTKGYVITYKLTLGELVRS